MQEDRDLVAGVIQLANLLIRRLGPVFGKAGVTPQQWAVLSVVASSDAAMSPVSISRRMGVSKQNMTGMVERLVQLNLVERLNDPADLRSARIQLTRRGKALIEKMAPVYEQWRESLANALPDRDLAALERGVNRLIAQLEQSS